MVRSAALTRDLGAVALFVAAAVLLIRTGVATEILEAAGRLRFVGGVIAGMFFCLCLHCRPGRHRAHRTLPANSLFGVAMAGGAGALIVASPLPDELGLLLMGLSRLRTTAFLPISFALNFLGILAVGLAVRALGS